MEKRKTRIMGYENLKFMLIVLVVLGHFLENQYSSGQKSFQVLFLAIYFFHMPAFIFLSGLVQNIEKKPDYRRVLAFVILGYVYKIFNSLLVFVGTGKWEFSLLKENGIPWFMFVMAICPVLAYLVREIKPVFMLTFAVIIGCMAGFDQSLADGFLVIGRTVVYFPFYLIGCYLNAEKLMNFCKNKKIKILSVFCLTGYCLSMTLFIDRLYKIRHIVTGKNPYNEWAIAHGSVLLRLLCYVGALLVIIALISLIPDKEFPVISKAGGNTLAVYFWHRNILKVVKATGVGEIIVSAAGGGIWIAPIIAVVLTLILSHDIFSRPLKYLLSGIYIKSSK